MSKRIEHTSADGVEHWAVIGDRPLDWGSRNRIRSASDKDFWLDFAPALVTASVTSWGEEGHCKDADAWGPVDAEFSDMVFQACLDLWKAKKAEAEIDPTVGPSES